MFHLRQTAQEGANHAGVGHYRGAPALGLSGNGRHGVLHTLKKIFKILASGSWDGRVGVQPALRIFRIARHDLVPIQSLPAPEGELMEKFDILDRQSAGLSAMDSAVCRARCRGLLKMWVSG